MTITVKSLVKRTEQAVAGKLTEAECTTLVAEIQAAKSERKAELATLNYDGQGKPGPARAAALASGEAGKILDTDRRALELDAELELLSSAYFSAQPCIEAARIREAGPKAAAAAKALPKAVEALARANAAQADARAEVERLRTDLLVARNIASQAGTEVAGITPELHDRMANELGWIVRERASTEHEPHNVRLTRQASERQLVAGWKPPPPRIHSPLRDLERDLDRDGYLRF